jgi:hypothetical protein
MERPHDRCMDNTRRHPDDLLDLARVLLLVQGSILIATTIEALVWGMAFAGSGGLAFVMSAGAAAGIFLARARLRADRRLSRRLVYVIESFALATFAIDSVLSIALTGALPPVVAILTRLVLPIAVNVLLRRSSRLHAPPAQMTLMEAMR